MVVGAFPIAKLAVLLVKQISKPIANVCKERAKNSPFFRTYVCMPPAQFYNWCEVKAKMWILNLGKPVNIPVLSEAMAIELGANLLGEGVIFVIGAGLLIIEYNRQTKKETAKEKKREEEMEHFTSTIRDLYFTVQQQQTQLREIERMIHSIDGLKSSTSPPQLPPPTKSTPPSEPTAPSTKPNLQSINYCQHENTEITPYPDKGIILQSLNYIQMDILSSLFPENLSDIKKPNEKVQTRQIREPAVVSSVLYNIENDFRSLF